MPRPRLSACQPCHGGAVGSCRQAQLAPAALHSLTAARAPPPPLGATLQRRARAPLLMALSGTWMSRPAAAALPATSPSFFTVSLPMCSSLEMWSSTLGISTWGGVGAAGAQRRATADAGPPRDLAAPAARTRRGSSRPPGLRPPQPLQGARTLPAVRVRRVATTKPSLTAWRTCSGAPRACTARTMRRKGGLRPDSMASEESAGPMWSRVRGVQSAVGERVRDVAPQHGLGGVCGGGRAGELSGRSVAGSRHQDGGRGLKEQSSSSRPALACRRRPCRTPSAAQPLTRDAEIRQHRHALPQRQRHLGFGGVGAACGEPRRGAQGRGRLAGWHGQEADRAAAAGGGGGPGVAGTGGSSGSGSGATAAAAAPQATPPPLPQSGSSGSGAATWREHPRWRRRRRRRTRAGAQQRLRLVVEQQGAGLQVLLRLLPRLRHLQGRHGGGGRWQAIRQAPRASAGDPPARRLRQSICSPRCLRHPRRVAAACTCAARQAGRQPGLPAGRSRVLPLPLPRPSAAAGRPCRPGARAPWHHTHCRPARRAAGKGAGRRTRRERTRPVSTRAGSGGGAAAGTRRHQARQPGAPPRPHLQRHVGQVGAQGLARGAVDELHPDGRVALGPHRVVHQVPAGCAGGQRGGVAGASRARTAPGPRRVVRQAPAGRGAGGKGALRSVRSHRVALTGTCG